MWIYIVLGKDPQQQNHFFSYIDPMLHWPQPEFEKYMVLNNTNSHCTPYSSD